MSSETGRIEWLDAARGIGIVLVVLGHVERGLLSAGFPMGRWWAFADFGLYAFHMPLFFLLAGLNVTRSLAHPPYDFVRTKLWTIAWPYLLWSLLQGGALVLLSGFTNTGADAVELLWTGWLPMSQFWFLYALFFYQMIALAVRGRTFPMLAIALAGLVAGSFLPTTSFPERMCHFLFFFVAGSVLSRRLCAMGRPAPAKIALAIGGWIMAALAGGIVVFPDHDALLLLPAAAAGIGATLLVARSLSGCPLAMAIRLGRASMAIFLMHILASAAVRIAMLRIGVPHDPSLYLATCTAAGVLAPLAAYDLARRWKIEPLLGLSAPPRQSRPPEVTA